MIVRPRDEICSVEIERQDGSSGDVSVDFTITSNSEALGGRPAERGVDWVDPDSLQVHFKNGETK